MTPHEAPHYQQQATILARLRDLNPGRRFAGSTDGNAIGLWLDHPTRGGPRFVMVMGRAIDGTWIDLQGIESWIDGQQPPYGPDEWRE